MNTFLASALYLVRLLAEWLAQCCGVLTGLCLQLPAAVPPPQRPQVFMLLYVGRSFCVIGTGLSQDILRTLTAPWVSLGWRKIKFKALSREDTHWQTVCKDLPLARFVWHTCHFVPALLLQIAFRGTRLNGTK